MKAKVAFSFLLAILFALYFIACNHDDSSPTYPETSLNQSQNISDAEAHFNFQKLLYGQELLIQSEKTDPVVFEKATKELKNNWQNFDMANAAQSDYYNVIAERINILEKYFPSLANFTSSKSNNAYTIQDGVCAHWRCEICGYIYDVAAGLPDHGIKPGTKFEDVPDDFYCPYCGAGKDRFYCVDDDWN